MTNAKVIEEIKLKVKTLSLADIAEVKAWLANYTEEIADGKFDKDYYHPAYDSYKTVLWVSNNYRAYDYHEEILITINHGVPIIRHTHGDNRGWGYKHQGFAKDFVAEHPEYKEAVDKYVDSVRRLGVEVNFDEI